MPQLIDQLLRACVHHLANTMPLTWCGVNVMLTTSKHMDTLKWEIRPFPFRCSRETYVGRRFKSRTQDRDPRQRARGDPKSLTTLEHR